MHKLIFISFFLIAFSASAAEMNFFGEPIDFWGDKKNEAVAPSTKKEPVKEKTKFNWKKYQDPNSKDFFKEGNYSPPEAFVELVKNPTDENIKNWFSYIELKNRLSNRLQKRLKIYAQKNSTALNDKEKISFSKVTSDLSTVPETVRNFRFRLYVDSKCPIARTCENSN